MVKFAGTTIEHIMFDLITFIWDFIVICLIGPCTLWLFTQIFTILVINCQGSIVTVLLSIHLYIQWSFRCPFHNIK
jgi:hypothetical protein